MPVPSLDELQQQIAQREQELERLRQELQSRQSHLDELTRRKEDLESQLRQVEEEIAALGLPTHAAAQREAKPPATRSAPRRRAGTESPPWLRDLILAMLGESTAMTSQQMCEEAQRRGYRPTTKDPVSSISARIQELRSEGLVQRAGDQPGYILAPTSNGTGKKNKPGKRTSTARARAAGKPATKQDKTPSATRPGKTPSAGSQEEQPPLRVVLTGILKASRKPLFGSELARQALAAGYISNSKNFTNTVTALLTNLETVEHIPDKGYRLKKT